MASTFTSSGQQPLMRIPLGEEYLTVVLLDDPHTLAVGDQRYLVGERILRAILLHSTIH